MNRLLESLDHLGTRERLQMVEDLWDSIKEDAAPVMSDAIYHELVRRSAWENANPSNSKILDEMARGLGVRL